MAILHHFEDFDYFVIQGYRRQFVILVEELKF